MTAQNGLDVTKHQIGRDFINVWAGPQLAFGGQLSTLFNLESYHAAIGQLFGQELPFHNWGYPLFTLPVFWPLAQLPYFAALTVFSLGLFAAYAGLTLSQIDRSRRPLALFVLALGPATLINVIGGENGFLRAALFLGGILQLDRRPILAGILFGLLTFKPHLGLILPFVLIALGAWRTIAAATVTACLLFVGSLALFGLEPWQQYVATAGAFRRCCSNAPRLLHDHDGVSLLRARISGLGYQAAMAIQIAA